MKKENRLFEFEEKYPFLYDVIYGGVPVYVALRDGVLGKLRDGENASSTVQAQPKAKVSIRRILDGFFKIRKFKNKKTLVFTTALYRRDKGRNLAAEFLIDKYEDVGILEWPMRSAAYDDAYFLDEKKGVYCPLDFYAVYSKIYYLFHKKEYAKLYNECKEQIEKEFAKNQTTLENEDAAIKYLLEELPVSYAETALNQAIAKKYFKGFKKVKTAIDFWGGARENITPSLYGDVTSVELQHGIITKNHPGYVYPAFVKNAKTDFFKRQMLVYGEKTKRILCEESVFESDRVEVIGNPRTATYKSKFGAESSGRKLILFASQPYEQDGAGIDYYKTVAPVLREVQRVMKTDKRWEGFRLGVKLHPRESNGALEFYKEQVVGIEVFDNTSQLYELLLESYLQVTVSSTTLYEAAEFGTPTVALKYGDLSAREIYGFDVKTIESQADVEGLFSQLIDECNYAEYTTYLKEKTKENM